MLVKSSDQSVLAWGPNTRLGDFVMEARVRRVADVDDANGLLFGLSDDSSRFNALFVDPNGYYSLFRYNQWGWESLLDWTLSSRLNTGLSSNHLMLVRRGSQITIYVNGKRITATGEPQLPAAGRPGFMRSR